MILRAIPAERGVPRDGWITARQTPPPSHCSWCGHSLERHGHALLCPDCDLLPRRRHPAGAW